ncbi:MAG: hypothetical protein AAGH15_13860 [Myxococcota bacterium]
MASRLVLAFALLAAAAPSVRAQSDPELCPPPGEPEPRTVTPATEARNVPTNALLRVAYSADLDVAVPAELFELFLCPAGTRVGEASPSICTDAIVGGGPEAVQIARDELLFAPVAPYLPQRVYAGTAFAPTGFGELRIAFETGVGPDLTAPVLPANAIDASGSSADFECEDIQNGVRIDVRVTPARLDSLDPRDPTGPTEPATSIEYLLFQTRGPGLAAPTLRARGRGITASTEVTLAFGLSADDASTPICVAVQAVDGQGAASDPSEDLCFEPITGNFFEGLCSAGAAPALPGLVPPLLAVLALARRRRRR